MSKIKLTKKDKKVYDKAWRKYLKNKLKYSTPKSELLDSIVELAIQEKAILLKYEAILYKHFHNYVTTR